MRAYPQNAGLTRNSTPGGVLPNGFRGRVCPLADFSGINGLGAALGTGQPIGRLVIASPAARHHVRGRAGVGVVADGLVPQMRAMVMVSHSRHGRDAIQPNRHCPKPRRPDVHPTTCGPGTLGGAGRLPVAVLPSPPGHRSGGGVVPAALTIPGGTQLRVKPQNGPLRRPKPPLGGPIRGHRRPSALPERRTHTTTTGPGSRYIEGRGVSRSEGSRLGNVGGLSGGR